MTKPRSIRYDPTAVPTGPQDPVNLDFIPDATTFVGVYSDGGAPSYGVEFTIDDVNDQDVTPRWFVLKDIPFGSSNSQYASFSFPAMFVRLNIALFTSPLELKISQSTQ